MLPVEYTPNGNPSIGDARLLEEQSLSAVEKPRLNGMTVLWTITYHSLPMNELLTRNEWFRLILIN